MSVIAKATALADVRSTTAEDEARLLRLLSGPEAVGRVDGERVIVFARQSRVSLRVGSVPLAAASALESAGAVQRNQRAGRPAEFTLTSGGAARYRRQQASASGDGFRRQHMDVVLKHHPAADAMVAVNEAESPLLWLHRRQGRGGRALIGDAEFAAGERLRSDLTIACSLPRLTANWERTASGGAVGLTPTEAMLAARQRVDRAMQAVGPEFSGLLTDVCGFLKGMDQLERERGWPARSAKVVLVLALAALARHYGLSNEATGAAGRGKPQMWGAGDYRPAFTGGDQPAASA